MAKKVYVVRYGDGKIEEYDNLKEFYDKKWPLEAAKMTAIVSPDFNAQLSARDRVWHTWNGIDTCIDKHAAMPFWFAELPVSAKADHPGDYKTVAQMRKRLSQYINEKHQKKSKCPICDPYYEYEPDESFISGSNGISAMEESKYGQSQGIRIQRNDEPESSATKLKIGDIFKRRDSNKYYQVVSLSARPVYNPSQTLGLLDLSTMDIVATDCDYAGLLDQKGLVYAAETEHIPLKDAKMIINHSEVKVCY